MTDAQINTAAPMPRPATRWGVPVAVVSAAVYTTLFLCGNHPWYPSPMRSFVTEAAGGLHVALRSVLQQGGIDAPGRNLSDGAYLLVVGCVAPWIIMAIIGRGRPSTLGLRVPNRYGYRILVVAFVISLPFLAWMVGGPRFADTYLARYRAGAGGFLLFYLVNMFGEHFLFHGVMLAAFRADRRWPSILPGGESRGRGVRGILRWVGLAQRPDAFEGAPALRWTRVRRWLGLPSGCSAAILASGALFGWAHVGKDVRELALSIPGGVALAFVAYRTSSWLTPFALHLATAGTACAIMVARHG